MTSSDVWDAGTAERYDEDSAGMFAPEVLDPAVVFLADLSGDGRALELAIGTGRVALPLAARGVPVAGIDLSEPVVEQLRRKPGYERIEVVVGDMATARVEGEFSLVYLVWNSISNLRTQAEQVACFRNAARHLRPGGRFVVELWIPEVRGLAVGRSVALATAEPGHVVVDELDLATQACVSHHYRHRPDGSVEHDTGRFRYAWPAELDLMAQLAGMTPEGRYGDWVGGAFDASSTSHVSVWRLP